MEKMQKIWIFLLVGVSSYIQANNDRVWAGAGYSSGSVMMPISISFETLHIPLNGHLPFVKPISEPYLELGYEYNFFPSLSAGITTQFSHSNKPSFAIYPAVSHHYNGPKFTAYGKYRLNQVAYGLGIALHHQTFIIDLNPSGLPGGQNMPAQSLNGLENSSIAHLDGIIPSFVLMTDIFVTPSVKANIHLVAQPVSFGEAHYMSRSDSALKPVTEDCWAYGVQIGLQHKIDLAK